MMDRSEAVAKIVSNKALSRREKLDAIRALGFKAEIKFGELTVLDGDSTVYSTMKNTVNFEGSPRAATTKEKSIAKAETATRSSMDNNAEVKS